MNLHTERLKAVSKVTQLISGRAGSRKFVSWFLNHSFNVDIEKENINAMIKPVLTQRNDATPPSNYKSHDLTFFFLSFFLSVFFHQPPHSFWCSPAIHPGSAICVASLKKLGRKTMLRSWFLPHHVDAGGCTVICRTQCAHSGKVQSLGDVMKFWLPGTACSAPQTRNWYILLKKSGCLRKLLNNYVLFATVILVIEGSERRISNPVCRRGWGGNGDVRTSCKA